jgi:hypothetical protein
MSHAEVRAAFVQRDCKKIIRWDDDRLDALTKKYVRFQGLVIHFVNKGIKPSLFNRNPKRPRWGEVGDFLYKHSWSWNRRDHYWSNKHIRAYKQHNSANYGQQARRLLALAERALADSNKIASASVMLSADDALYLKNMMVKIKEKHD